ncbi:hypothetical protein FRC04_003765 [Tulasnella sp. 424]|nr:hypothetical protein FRC04_003765 [Tulasnella sp. 424]
MAICRDSNHRHAVNVANNRPQSDAQNDANSHDEVLTVNPNSHTLEPWIWPRYEVSGQLMPPQYLWDYCKPRRLLPLCYCAQSGDMTDVPNDLLDGCVAMIGRASDGGWYYLTCHQYLPQRFLQPGAQHVTCGLHVNLTEVFQHLTSPPAPLSVVSTPSTPSHASAADKDDPFVFVPSTPGPRSTRSGTSQRMTPRSLPQVSRSTIPATPSSVVATSPASTSGVATRNTGNTHLGTPQASAIHQVSKPITPRAPPPSYTPSSVASFPASSSSKHTHRQNSSTTSTSSVSTAPPPSTRLRFDPPAAPMLSLLQPMFSTGVSSSTGAGVVPRGQTPFGDQDFLPSPQPASVSSSQLASFTNENAAADATELGWVRPDSIPAPGMLPQWSAPIAK